MKDGDIQLGCGSLQEDQNNRKDQDNRKDQGNRKDTGNEGPG